MSMRIEWADVDDAGFEVMPPGESLAGQTLESGEWGLSIGGVVVYGPRDALVAELRDALHSLTESALAEHENGYHRGAPESECPGCVADAAEDAAAQS